MHISSVMNYTVRQFINDFLQNYGYFSYNNIRVYCHIHGTEGEDGSCYIDEYSLPFQLYYGLSKACLNFNDRKVVVKIPMETSCRFDKYRTDFFKMKIKDGQYPTFNNEENLCEVEASIYKLAKESGLGEFFAEEEKLMTYHGVPVYIQERVQAYCDTPDCGDDYDMHLSEPIDKLLHKNYDFIDEDSSEVIDQFTQNVFFVERLYEEAGEGRFIHFLDFLIINNINDLHSGNIGYGAKGELKLMDYSGFNN